MVDQIIGTFGNTLLAIRRDDLLHPRMPGNKFRKLKYNLEEMKSLGHLRLLTFGGAFSNHIAAVAAAGSDLGLETIGIIRGEELQDRPLNHTLKAARKQGMTLAFVSREEYRRKEEPAFLEALQERFGNYYLLPEGGTNEAAIRGCEEILGPEDGGFDYICCAVGTGGTLSGIINSTADHQTVLGFPALQGDFLAENIAKWTSRNNWRLIQGFSFGGYGKTTATFISFLNDFYEEYRIPLDPVYTGKMMFGVMTMIRNGYFPDHSRILAIHTGGLQGIAGMNETLKQKKLPLIQYG